MTSSDLIASALGLAHDVVHFAFTTEGLETRWHVRRFRLHEALCEPYRLELELVTEDHVTLDALLGLSCTLVLDREGQGRRVHGVVHRAEALDPVAGRQRVRVFAGPALYLLSQRRDTRFWQDMSAPEILGEVLEAPLAEHGRALYTSLDVASYRKREYCVQYRETDLEFAERLMREEGIVYAFEHDEDVERLVLVGSTVNAQDLGIAPVPFVAEGTGAAYKQSVDALDWAASLTTTSIVQRDWDWQQASPSAYMRQRRGLDVRDRDRERYDHDDRRLHADDGEKRARHKLEADVTPAQQGRGASDIVELVPGRCFEVLYHPDLERDGRYLVLAVEHTGFAAEVLHYSSGAGGAGDEPRYHNTFRVMRPDVPYLDPQPPARPRVHGPHTAIVVGPGSEEIHTDEFGRIKVLFHWDRLSPPDDTASCWIRVAHNWAGLGWGAQFLPRIGMEVLVEFIDGDPDRPIVTGCVYNGLNHHPYKLPDEKTRSGIKTDSSPGGGGSNELRFEDARGSEEVWLHAQKDFNEKVENCHTTTVGSDQSNSVGGNQSNSVTGNQTESVSGNQTMSVTKNRNVTITGSQAVTILGAKPESGVSGSKLTITGDYKLDASNTIAIQAPTHIKLTCGGSSILIEPGKITLTAGGAATIVLDANALMKSAAGSKVFLDANAFAQASGGGKLLLDANALAQAAAGAKLFLDANALAQSAGGSKLLLDGNALMSSPAAAAVSAPTSTLAGGGGTVQAGGPGVTCTGGQVNLSGGMVNISGGLVKIN